MNCEVTYAVQYWQTTHSVCNNLYYAERKLSESSSCDNTVSAAFLVLAVTVAARVFCFQQVESQTTLVYTSDARRSVSKYNRA